jgi:hypothetical protein
MMFERLRATMSQRLATDQTAAQQAVSARDTLATGLAQQQNGLAQLQAAATAAQATVNARNQDVASAQAVVAQRAAALQSAQTTLDERNQALEEHEQNEPPFHLPGAPGPNPEWVAWNAVEQQLIHARDQAEDAVNAASAALNQAQQNRAAAVAAAAAAVTALNDANVQVAAAGAGIADTQQRLATAETTVITTAQRVAADQAQLQTLAEREATLTAQPLDWAAVAGAADAELAEVLSAWQRRHDLLGQRVTARAERAELLTPHDVMVDELAALSAEIGASPVRTRWPGLASVLAALDGVVSAAAAQRGRPPDQRTDDLPGVRDTLAGQVTAVLAVVEPATGERDQARIALDQVAEQLRVHEAEGP